MNMIRVA